MVVHVAEAEDDLNYNVYKSSFRTTTQNLFGRHLMTKIPHRNRSQVQVSLKVTAQIDNLNITVTLDFFSMFDQSPEIAGKLNNHVLDYK